MAMPVDAAAPDMNMIFPKVEIDLILGVLDLAKSNKPYVVDFGQVVVASQAVDHDGIPEIYFAGEVVERRKYRNNTKSLIWVLKEYPGPISITAQERLSGISRNPSDQAVATFLYHLHIQDPIKLISREADLTSLEGRQHLNHEVKRLIEEELRSTLNDKIQLWTSNAIGEVSGKLFSRLNAKLDAWGLQVDYNPVSNRKYPQQLYEIQLQFRASERYLFADTLEKKLPLLERLGLKPEDWTPMRIFSKQNGEGAGLFDAAKNRKNSNGQIARFIEWLGSDEQKALAAANFLKDLYCGNYGKIEIELSEQIVLSTFRNIMLCVGEWGETE